jgi:hypothetical protein
VQRFARPDLPRVRGSGYHGVPPPDIERCTLSLAHPKESPMTSPVPRRWPFIPTLRLAAIALIIAIASLLFEGWTGDVLMVVAMLLALWGVAGYVKAWRRRSQSTG